MATAGISSKHRPAPDFVIAGAPKCGTTALYSYLSTHSGIAMSSRKEPYFWCPDIAVRAPVTNASDYEALWAEAPKGALRGEATPATLRSAVAAGAILAVRPDAKFIVMLRSPAEMAASFHAQMLASLQEDVADFEKAWCLQESRRRGQRIPALCFFPPNLQYGEVCALGDQLERLMAIVPRHQLYVMLQDELRADPRAAYLEVLRFLGVDDDGRDTFEPVNRGKRRRALPLVRLHRRIASSYRGIGMLDRVLGLTRIVERLSLEEKPRAPIDAAFASTLHAFFLPQVEKIELLLGCDLDAWKRPPTDTGR